jgi:hypothetical protein
MGLWLVMTTLAYGQSAQVMPQAVNLGQLVDALKPDATQDEQLQAMVLTARNIIKLPVIKRIFSYDELCKADGTTMRALSHSRPAAIKHPVVREHFALATSDQESTGIIVNELPYLAACYRLTGDKAFLDYLIAQLNEVATWSPLQRPGWSMPASGRTELAPGGDGVWLATGIGIRAIVYTRQLLPPGALPASLDASLNKLLLSEMNQIYSDWQTQKPWYVRDQMVQSNQWVVPNEGLMLAVCALGRDKYPKEYALARENLFKTMATFGDEGAISEGFTYALGLTLLGVQSSAMAMAQAGDFEALNNPFIRKYGDWLVSHYQPGTYVVNDFDGYGACRGMYDRGMNAKIEQLAVLSGNKALLWALSHQHHQLSHDLFGMLTTAMLKAQPNLPTPPTQYQWDIARAVFWRSSWADDASGLWVRGRHPKDFHDHHDAGNVNFIVGGQAAIIESGTSGYRNPRLAQDYRSVCGHNVLQIDEELNTVQHNDIPITVSRMDAAGGELEIHPTPAYPQLQDWARKISWDTTHLTVHDSVAVKEGTKHQLTFRYLLGTQEKMTVTPVKLNDSLAGYAYDITIPAGRKEFTGWPGSGKDYWIIPEKDILLTPAMTIRVQSIWPIEVIASEHINHTMRFRFQAMPNTMLLIRTPGPATQMDITMSMHVTPNAGK